MSLLTANLFDHSPRDHRQILIIDFSLAIFPLDSKPCPYWRLLYIQIIHNYTYTYIYIYICSGSTRFSQVSLRGSTRILFSQALNVCKCSRCYIYIYSLLTYFTSSPNCFPFPLVVVVDQPSHLSVSVWPAVYIPPREFNDFSLIYT